MKATQNAPLILRSATTVVVSATSPWEIQFFSDPMGKHHITSQRERERGCQDRFGKKEGEER